MGQDHVINVNMIKGMTAYEPFAKSLKISKESFGKSIQDWSKHDIEMYSKEHYGKFQNIFSFNITVLKLPNGVYFFIKPHDHSAHTDMVGFSDKKTIFSRTVIGEELSEKIEYCVVSRFIDSEAVLTFALQADNGQVGDSHVRDFKVLANLPLTLSGLERFEWVNESRMESEHLGGGYIDDFGDHVFYSSLERDDYESNGVRITI